MPIFNGAELVQKGIDSILNQTYGNFELIIVNDGSTDNTIEVLNSYKDSRLRVISQENRGISNAINAGHCFAKGSLIAHHDHDDISLPQRFEKQINFLSKNSEIGLVGTAAEVWNVSGPTGRFLDHPTTPGEVAFELIFNNCLVHSSWMYRQELIKEVGSYSTDTHRQPPEDYEFISRLIRKFRATNLSERLVIYREIPNSTSSASRSGENIPFSKRLALISAENISYAAEVNLSSNQAINFGAITHNYIEGINSKPNLKDIKKLVITAGEKLALRYHEPNILNLVDSKLDHLSHQYYAYSGVASNLEILMQQSNLFLARLRFKIQGLILKP